MNAPLRTLATCDLGHTLVDGRCVACAKARRAGRAPYAEPATGTDPERLRAVLRKRARRVPRPCELHTDEVAPCPRCAKAHAENAKSLAETVPFHERWRHFAAHEPTPEMIKEAARMFAHPLTLPPIKSEDHR